ncbi:hypothetical protein GCM10022221_18290 [Actinocorallia aurea]
MSVVENTICTAAGKALLVTSVEGRGGDPSMTEIRMEFGAGQSIGIPLGAARYFAHFADEDDSPAARQFAESFAEVVALVEGLFSEESR